MNPRTAKSKRGPEHLIQDEIICMLRNYGWFVKTLSSSQFQSGMPDLFACHTRYGIRLIEVKLPGMVGSKFTPAQLEDFPKLTANGAGVWVLTGNSDTEYKKLFERFNWWKYLDCFK